MSTVTDTRPSSAVYEVGIDDIDRDTYDSIVTGRIETTAGSVIVNAVAPTEGYYGSWSVKGTLPAVIAYVMDHVTSELEEITEILVDAYVAD